jgi:energy-converting hydrogenase A subunit M
MSISVLNKYFYNDIINIIMDYLMIDVDEVVQNKYIVNIHLNAMFELRQRVKQNKAATFSFVHQHDEDLELDLYFKDVLTTMIVVKD